MATTRRKITRGRKQLDVSPALQDYFFTGDKANVKQLLGWQVARWQCLCDKEELLSLWQHNRDALLKIWIEKNPCKRPYFWWKWDSPRTEIEPFNHDFPGQRLRLGGIGTPTHEVLNIVPHFGFGIPDSWVDQWSVDYYNGRAKDIHGKPIGQQRRDGSQRVDGDFKGLAIDPTDPPVYESEAAYLSRHELLTAGEVKHLAKNPELMQPERVLLV